MSVSITTFRQAVQDELAADLAISFVAGELQGPIENGPLGCCWAPEKAEVSGNVEDEEIELHARVFARFQSQVTPEHPENAATLESLAESIQAAIKDKQTTLGPWFVRVTRLELDHGAQVVEATIVGRQENRGL